MRDLRCGRDISDSSISTYFATLVVKMHGSALVGGGRSATRTHGLSFPGRVRPVAAGGQGAAYLEVRQKVRARERYPRSTDLVAD